jgi:cell division protease FtsH
MTLRYVLRTKPQEIRPQSSDSIGWDDVAGVDEANAELREVVVFMRDPKRFKRLGAKVPKGILLHGPPGTGKTLLAKAVAHESNAKFFAQSASSFVEMYAGLGAARIRRLFRVARKQAPAIIFIDELDAVGATRGKDISGEKDQTLNQLLVEMDGFASADNIVVVGASNLLDKLDPALLRPGRFDARSSYRRPTSWAATTSCASTRATSHSAASTSRWSRARRAASPAPTWPTSARRRRSSPAGRCAT